MATASVTRSTTNKAALIMGVANQRSIAMSCARAFIDRGWDVILTTQNENTKNKIQTMIDKSKHEMTSTNNDNGNNNSGKLLGVFPCDVTDDKSIELFFREYLEETLHKNNKQHMEAVIHSLAFAPQLKNPLLETTREAYLEAHEVSAYSLIQVTKESLPYLTCRKGTKNNNSSSSSSITTLSYLGAEKAILGYNIMGPAKASLESIVRGLALELGQKQQLHAVRVNAVRSGPIPTISSKGGISGFGRMRQDVQDRAPLGNVSALQVATTVYHVAAEAFGMTGQTIDVDGGYSIVSGPPIV